MRQLLDARGKACPMPVVETKKIVEDLNEGDIVEVIVDNFIAIQNLKKMAEQNNLPFSSEKVGENEYVATITVVGINRSEIVEVGDKMSCIPDMKMDKTVVVVSSDKMGVGDEKLGRILMKGFIYALNEMEHLPQTILLYNSGACLSVEGSDSLADLKLLESQGVEVLTCGTCLNHYGLSNELRVGSVTNMYVIVEKQMQATKVINP